MLPPIIVNSCARVYNLARVKFVGEEQTVYVKINPAQWARGKVIAAMGDTARVKVELGPLASIDTWFRVEFLRTATEPSGSNSTPAA